jgi:hypothetical protein
LLRMVVAKVTYTACDLCEKYEKYDKDDTT